MANYKGHILGGLIAGTVVVSSLNLVQSGLLPSSQELLDQWQTTIGLISIAVLFALWPDVDTNSKAQNLFYSLAIFINIILIISEFYIFSSLLGLLAMTPIVGKHRGWTHKKLAAFLVPLPILILPILANDQINQYGLLGYIFAVAGYLSHLLLDGLIFKRIKLKGSWR